MSLLGFDALGRLALGQLSTIGATNTVMATDPGTYAATGQQVGFRTSLPSSVVIFAAPGSGAPLRIGFAVQTAGYLFTGAGTSLRPALIAGRSGFAVATSDARFAGRIPSSGGTVTASGEAGRLKSSLAALTGSCSFAGFLAGFTRDFEAWVPRPFDDGVWAAIQGYDEAWTPTGSPQAQETWSVHLRQPPAWTSEVKQPEKWTVE